MRKNIKKPIQKGVARVPVIIQMEALECGAACLAMVMAYYNRWVPLEQVRVDCGVSRDGSNARNMLMAARNYGFEAKGYRLEPKELKEGGSFPCIAHWDFNHFVVVDGFRGDKVYINDPARGAVRITMKEFDDSFTGIALIIEPGENFVPGGKRKSVLDFAKKRLKGTGAAIVFVALTTVISYLFSIINPVMSQVFMDRLLTGLNPQWLMPFIWIMAGLAILQLAVQAVSVVYSLRINGKMAVTGSSSYMWKVLRLPMDFFSQRMIGDILQRKNTNATIAQTLVTTLAPLALNLMMLIFYLVVMIRYSLVLTGIGIATLAMNMIISRIISSKRVNLTRVQMRDLGNLSSATVNGISMIETIKASGAENGFFRKWAGYQAKVNREDISYSKISLYLGMIPALFTQLADYAVIFLGVLYTMEGSFTLGSMVAFQGVLSSFMAPAMSMISSGAAIQEMRTDMERIEDVMNYPDDPYVNDDAVQEDVSYAKLSGNIEIKDVSFGYSRLAEPLIRDFSMSIKQGSRVAFVGASGCGKSTLAKLISGLYQPWSGSITFDGKSIGEIDRSVFKGSLSVIDQDIILFEDTIANNIKMWDESIQDFEMILAARDAQIHEDIVQREGGYSHRLTEGGKDLSGGQRQRLEIARALCQDPTIIILDEATSALDAKVEYEVVKSIKDRGITCIVIAHRLSTIRDCDEIVVLEHGAVVERGTHDELYAKGGYYKELVSNE